MFQLTDSQGRQLDSTKLRIAVNRIKDGALHIEPIHGGREARCIVGDEQFTEQFARRADGEQ